MELQQILTDIGLKRLTKTGSGFKALCPYHADHKLGNFNISEEKGIAKCFACGEGRTLFAFLVEHGAPFDEAIEYAFKEYKKTDRELKEVTDIVLGRFLPKSFIDRGFTPETLQHFRVGFDDVEKRTTIPMTLAGKDYGVKFRVYPKEFWYSDNFPKENFVYNYEPSEDRIYVESETDTWRAWQNGTKNVSAILGSEVSDKQAELMSVHKNLYLAFDNDIAGFKATMSAINKLKYDCNIFVLKYNAEDAGACEAKEWLRAYQNPKTYLEFEIALEKNNPELYNELKRK